MDREIGKTFMWEGRTLEVAPATGTSHVCEGCYFYEHEKQCHDVNEMCSDESRDDRRNVIFKEIGKQTKEEVQ